MKVWLYYRLSRDEDDELNSLTNQRKIIYEYAVMLTAAVQAKQVDAVLVKDLSRLGRHRTQTALFIDYLREHQVRVISVTEGVDTFCEEDDLMIGVRGLMNDYYAKISE